MPNQTELEWNEPHSFEDWQQCDFAKETLSQAYFEAGEEVRKSLKSVPAKNEEERAKIQSQAYCDIDNKMDDEYQSYVAMHPNTLGFCTATFADIYYQDGL